MGSPTGIFTDLTAQELSDLRSNALTRIASGDRTSLSGGGKSGTKSYSMSARDVLMEVKYAEQKLGLAPARVTKTYMDTANPPPQGTAQFEQQV